MDATASHRTPSRRTRALRVLAGVGGALAIAAPVAAASGPQVNFHQAPGAQGASAQDESKGGQATDTVKRWQSPKSYTSPYALVEVSHDGKNLDRVPVSRCRGHYVDSQIDVLISTCGARWHVRASYVSLSGTNEPFRISYQALNRAP